MPLKPSQILNQLNAKRSEFTAFDETTFKQLELYKRALREVMQLSTAELQQRLAKKRHCGAFPLEPLEANTSWIMPFGLSWNNREESNTWVREQLTNVSTFAVDGSQIYPGKDLSVPIALVQIGWFENLHTAQGEYFKDIECYVMTPQDLRVEKLGELADRKVNMQRFAMETQRIIDYLEEHEGVENALAFFDGSFVVSFAEAFDEETTQVYVSCVKRLLEASEYYRVPVVAFIDTTTARDIASMLQSLFSLPDNKAIHDAKLLSYIEPVNNPGPAIAWQWGDRSPLFLCQRSGILEAYGEQMQNVTFCYLKTNRDSLPARLELPLWVYEAGRADQVIDWVRAEVAIGGGYPYVIETADQVAVVQANDRQTFYRILQDWAEKEDLKLRLSRKMVSKARRR
ncbi:DNA double-strand break repair nuclease NurA [Alkalinema sp. FACHB-956]|uniref:DNA double-strand break repair nuclease NurA n=1 Tax=Alkalinema sp. FACHB-956 TaxID=2692768 RepID=UPI00168585BF|nr:DNA double-strand break repair nuclease NurA [Alkalinema sp. FACHB-956]MBD2325455.1 DNA double-strand break repair nuclease NurA [Alkalinema sp. FACHB-956]